MTQKKLGIIQSRGLGDIAIALPIAWHYHSKGHEVYWPICEEFVPTWKNAAPWVRWITVPADPGGAFFYEQPMQRLKNLGVKDIICLYQSLSSNPELSQTPYFQIQKFDEFKYSRAGVPFLNKWKLNDCITRNPEREDALYKQLVQQPLYYVTHLEGSNFKVDPDLSSMPSEWARIDIDSTVTDNVFDWLKIIENAQVLVMVDSIFANLVDQLNMTLDKYWIPRSHIHLTPVLGSDWTILDPPPDSLAAQRIFASAK
jgi:hypothetical protein